jgi:hypothetical protein
MLALGSEWPRVQLDNQSVSTGSVVTSESTH